MCPRKIYLLLLLALTFSDSIANPVPKLRGAYEGSGAKNLNLLKVLGTLVAAGEEAVGSTVEKVFAFGASNDYGNYTTPQHNRHREYKKYINTQDHGHEAPATGGERSVNSKQNEESILMTTAPDANQNGPAAAVASNPVNKPAADAPHEQPKGEDKADSGDAVASDSQKRSVKTDEDTSSLIRSKRQVAEQGVSKSDPVVSVDSSSDNQSVVRHERHIEDHHSHAHKYESHGAPASSSSRNFDPSSKIFTSTLADVAEGVAEASKSVSNVLTLNKSMRKNVKPLREIADAAGALRVVAGASDAIRTVALAGEAFKAVGDASESLKAVGQASEALKTIAKAADSLKKLSEVTDSLKSLAGVSDAFRIVSATSELAKSASESTDESLGRRGSGGSGDSESGEQAEFLRWKQRKAKEREGTRSADGGVLSTFNKFIASGSSSSSNNFRQPKSPKESVERARGPTGGDDDDDDDDCTLRILNPLAWGRLC